MVATSRYQTSMCDLTDLEMSSMELKKWTVPRGLSCYMPVSDIITSLLIIHSLGLELDETA